MVEIAKELKTALNNFISTMKPIIIVVALILSVILVIFCAFKIIYARKSEERADAFMNLYTVLMGLGLIGVLMSIMGFLVDIIKI